jgi:hypothetical protein
MNEQLPISTGYGPDGQFCPGTSDDETIII